MLHVYARKQQCLWLRAEWEQGLSQLQLQNKSADGQTNTVSAPSQAQDSSQRHIQPDAARAYDQSDVPYTVAEGYSDQDDEIELPFDGKHILEVSGISMLKSDSQLEKQVASLVPASMPPIIRHVHAPIALQVCFGH